LREMEADVGAAASSLPAPLHPDGAHPGASRPEQGPDVARIPVEIGAGRRSALRKLAAGDDGWPRAVRRTASLVAVVVLWQVASTRGWTGAAVPTPAATWDAFARLVESGQLWESVSKSLGRVVRGMAIGVSAGLLLGAAAGLFRLGEDLIDPPLQALRLIPYVALVPFFIVWLGIGEESKFGLVTLGSFFPVYLHTFHGIRAVDVRYIEAASSFGVGRLGVMWHVIAPASLPQLLIGLRQSIAIAWITLVVAEQIAVDAGLGALLQEARQYLQTDVMFVCLLAYAAFGLLADLLIRGLERRTLVWRRSFRGS